MDENSKYTHPQKFPSRKQNSVIANLEVHPRHHYTFCPRCAAKGELREFDFSFKCNACGFHFFLNSAAAVTALIFNSEGELLVTRRGFDPEKGKLDLPGGFIDPLENAEQALMRELKEELELVPEKMEYFGSFPNQYLFSGTTVYTVDLVFKCTVNDFSNMKSHDDVVGWEFLLPEEIDPEDFPFESVKNILIRIKNEGNN